MSVHLQCHAQLPFAEHFDRRSPFPDYPELVEYLRGHRAAGLEPSLLDELLQASHVDLLVFHPQRIAEPALGQAPMERHLPAFKARRLRKA